MGVAALPVSAQDQPSRGISLERGEIQTLSVDELQRIAIGDPAIAELTVVSASEVLIQAKALGKTNLLLWDRQGQRTMGLEVIDRAPEAAQEQLRQLLDELKLPKVQVRRENNKLFLVGSVETQSELDRVEQMLVSYPGVTNLIAAPPPPPPPSPAPQPLVKLTVQIIEMNRKDLEKLGVKWSESVAITQPAATDQTLNEALWRWGTGLSRGSVAATINALVEKNRARILSEPKLVTGSGKEASSFIGLEVPIVTATSFSTTTAASSASIEFRKTGVLLKMTPNVHAEEGSEQKKITTIIEAEVSGIDDSVALQVPVGNQTVSVPGFTVRKANTQVTTVSGETIMIAGLLSAEDSNEISQVPAFGSLPLFGRLFRSPKVESTQQELVIVVTPELLGDAQSMAEESAAIDRAMAVVRVTPSGGPTLLYAMQVQERIASSLQYPLGAKEVGMGGRVKLRLHLLRDGTLEQALIAESSGIDALDQESLRAAREQSPYPPFPSDLLQQELWLELPVLFRP